MITGASSGIGRATAQEMARRGANVVLAARRADRLEEVATSCRTLGARAVTVSTDVRSADACRSLIAAAGEVDVLVNNAGFAIFDSAAEASLADLREMMDTNYFGAVHCTQAVLPGMLARRAGTIVNVASILGLMGAARMSGYCATKFALVGFSEAVRAEVIGSGVKVALVCPGTTETEFFERAEKHKIPAASRLIPELSPERVAHAICDAAEDGRYRRILPALAVPYMRMKEIFPRFAHMLFRHVSAFLERR